MKKPSFLLIFLLSSITALAQSVKYETFIYSSDDLADEIQSLCEERNSTRSYVGDLFNASKESAKGGKSSVSCPLKPSDSAPLKHSTMPP